MGTSLVYHTIVHKSTHVGQASERQTVKGLDVWGPLSRYIGKFS